MTPQPGNETKKLLILNYLTERKKPGDFQLCDGMRAVRREELKHPVGGGRPIARKLTKCDYGFRFSNDRQSGDGLHPVPGPDWLRSISPQTSHICDHESNRSCRGNKERLLAFRNHSCRKTSAGFARAALAACQPTVKRAMPSASAPESANVHQPTLTR